MENMSNGQKELIAQSLVTIKNLKRELDKEKYRSTEPIAIVGMACRFPGACDTPEGFWTFLVEGREELVDIPGDRWDNEAIYAPNSREFGKSYVKKSHFLRKNIAEFDARFFRVSPAEANEMDPQQRQLLEVCWEALENAGINPVKTRGSKTGVFIGISSNCEYGKLPQDAKKINQYIATGTNSSIASGRISYVYGWNGPSLSTDTACSSSLVSAKLAVDSLRRGECNMAIAGGVNLLISSDVMSSLCMMHAVSEDGRCKPFDKAADGYGRGEGCGILVLKRLTDAQRDGDNIHALLRGGAVNNDGASSGITVPNGKAQEMVLKQALDNCGYTPEDITYLESHGTGTSLGDPIEIAAITEVYKRTSEETEPLVIGAVKGNIGHLESAAGIASLIKVILAIKHKTIPPNINFNSLNPRIKLEGIPAVLPIKNVRWNPAKDKKRVAAVSSFGFSGTNANLILSEYEEEAYEVRGDGTETLITLSAKDEPSLIQLIRDYQSYIQLNPNTAIENIGYTTNTGRACFPHRAVIIASNLKDLGNALGDLLRTAEVEETLYTNKVELIGSSQGSTRNGFKRTLFAQLSGGNTYTAKVDSQISPKLAFLFHGSVQYYEIINKELSKRFSQYSNSWENCRNIFRRYEDELLPQAVVREAEYHLQMNSFCCEYAFSLLLDLWDIKPEVVLGDEVGLFVSAIVAGLISLDDAVKLFVLRKRLGDIDDEAVRQLQDAISVMKVNKPLCRLITGAAGGELNTQMSVASYLIENIRGDSNSNESLSYIYEQGYRFVVSFGACSDEASFASLPNEDIVWITALTEKKTMSETLHLLGKVISLGAEMKWEQYYDGSQRRSELLPNYPFEGSKYWLYPVDENQQQKGLLSGQLKKNPLAYELLNIPSRQKNYYFKFSYKNFPELIDNSGVVHVGYFLEMLNSIFSLGNTKAMYQLNEMKFMNPIMVFEGETKEVMLAIESAGEYLFRYKFYSKNEDQENWNLSLEGEMTLKADQQPMDPVELTAPDGGQRVNRESFYEPLESRGFFFGPTVKWVDTIEYANNKALIHFRMGTESENADHYTLGFHPGVLDSCAQSFNYIAVHDSDNPRKYMISGLSGVSCHSVAQTAVMNAWAEIYSISSDLKEIKGRLKVYNSDGDECIFINEVSLKEFSEENLGKVKSIIDSAANANNTLDKNFLETYNQSGVRERIEMLTLYVRDLTADVLEMEPEVLDMEQSLLDMGLDSMSGVSLYNIISQSLGVEVSFSDLIHADTVIEIAQFIMGLMGGEGFAMKTKKAAKMELGIHQWIYNYEDNHNAKIRMFCFPYGFGSADMYKEWQKMLGNEIDICAIKLPGLDYQRMDEEPPKDLDKFSLELIKLLQEEGLLDIPCVTFGHSWGSLFAYRMAYQLEKIPNVNVVNVMISSYTSVSQRNSSLQKIVDELSLVGFDHIPAYEEVKANDAVESVCKAFIAGWGLESENMDIAINGAKLTLPFLLAAYSLIDQFCFSANDMIHIPIVGFHGIDDHRVTLEEMNNWEQVTSEGFSLYTMAGDHAFIDKNQSEGHLIQLLQEILIRCVRTVQ